MFKNFIHFIGSRLRVRSACCILTMLITSCLSVFIVLFVKSTHSEESPIVKLPNGRLVGFEENILNKSLYTYLHIPYALPASQTRFKPPKVDDRRWNEDRNAKKYGPGCPQPAKYIKFQNFAQTGFINYDEDCLHLNIWSPVYFNQTNPPTTQLLKPVIVFIHGGALLFNSASEEKYFDGRILASLGDVVVVTLNYRLGKIKTTILHSFFTHLTHFKLGIFGFLYDGNEIKGNLGLLDQRLAFEWVSVSHLQNEVEQFNLSFVYIGT